MAHIGILTSGDDCPGLNAVIRACALCDIRGSDHSFVGFVDGWRGVLDRDTVDLD